MQNLPKFLCPEDVEILIKSAGTYKNTVIIRTIYTLGLRVSECANIRIVDIDYHKKMVLIAGKFLKQRYLAVPDYLFHQWDDVMKLSLPKVYLFENAFGDGYGPRRLREIVNNAAKRAGIEHTSPHKLRHSRATQLLNDSVPLPHLQRFLGHANEATTAIYTGLAVEVMRKFL